MNPQRIAPDQLHRFGTFFHNQKPIKHDYPLTNAIEQAKKKYPEQTARAEEFGNLLRTLALTDDQMKTFVETGCIDHFMAPGVEQPVSYRSEGATGDAQRWGVMLKNLHQRCSTEATQKLYDRFSPELKQSLEALKQELGLS